MLVTIDVQPHQLGIPTKAYYAVNSSLGSSKEAFVPVSTEIAPPEVEEIGTSKPVFWLIVSEREESSHTYMVKFILDF